MSSKYFKSLILSILFVAAGNSMVCAQDKKGIVYFMRLPVEGRMSVVEHAANYCNVFIDSIYVCTLDEYRYFSVELPVGKHVFAMQRIGRKLQANFRNTKSDIALDIEEGKTYYIQYVFSKFADRDGRYCKLLKEDLAQLILPDLKPDKSCVE